MSKPDFGALLSGHRKYFQSGATRSAGWRKEQLIAMSLVYQRRCPFWNQV